MHKLKKLLIVSTLAAFPTMGSAETQLSLYGGLQSALAGRVSGQDDLGSPFGFAVDWQGRSFEMPPYYGLRATRWISAAWGYSLEFTHAKTYADDATLASSGFEMLEFTDGLNIVTLNLMRRFDEFSALQFYAGAGIGVSVPHVEVQTRVGGPVTFEYQLAGPAARGFFGVEYDLSESWSLFGEMNVTGSWNELELTGGGDMSASLFTHAINLGASFRF